VSDVLTLLGVGLLVVVGLAALGIFAAAATLIGWIIAIPFVILGWVFRLLVAIVAVPFALVMALLVGVVPAILVAAGLMFIVAPILPLVIVVGLTIWFFRRGRRPAPAPATTP
jgi:hypothetical protein